MTYECFADKETPGSWRVEGFNAKSGDVAITVFHGYRAAERSREYYNFIITTEKS